MVYNFRARTYIKLISRGLNESGRDKKGEKL